MMEFPQIISFTVTNACNLRCRMCGQWSEEGYINTGVKDSGSKMKLADWKRLVDEVSAHKIKFILVRGGEPFLFPGIIELLEYINSKGIFISLDTNGTVLEKYAADLVRIGNMHITFSIDGPEDIHDSVRGIKGSFKKTKDNIALLNELEKNNENKLSKSACFTISQYNYKGLGKMPDIMRELGLGSINIVPYYYISQEVGEKYEEELRSNFGCQAFSWKGFHHNDSGVDFDIFKEEHGKFLDNLKDVYNYPYLPLTIDEYKTWFSDPYTPIGSSTCNNVECLVDIQPDGNANFCIDYPDYSFGNVKEAAIKEIWNSPEAGQFRKYIRKKLLAVCFRCGAKNISEIRE